jgi:hypothetical protein
MEMNLVRRNMSKNKSFTVMAKLNITCCTIVNAPSLEEAIIRARELKEKDFVDIYDYGDMEITGVFE